MADHGGTEREMQDILITSKMESGVENKRALIQRLVKNSESCECEGEGGNESCDC